MVLFTVLRTRAPAFVIITVPFDSIRNDCVVWVNTLPFASGSPSTLYWFGITHSKVPSEKGAGAALIAALSLAGAAVLSSAILTKFAFGWWNNWAAVNWLLKYPDIFVAGPGTSYVC